MVESLITSIVELDMLKFGIIEDINEALIASIE